MSLFISRHIWYIKNIQIVNPTGSRAKITSNRGRTRKSADKNIKMIVGLIPSEKHLNL